MTVIDEKATRIISGKSTLEKELKTASTTEALALCLIVDRPSLLPDGDRFDAWQRLDDRQRQSVAHHNRSMGFNMAAATAYLAATQPHK